MTSRQTEVERTRARHAEFPSIPQLQNKSRIRDEKYREGLERKEIDVRGKLATLRDSLVKSLGKSLSLANFDNRPESVLSQTAGKDLDNKIVKLEDNFKEQQASWVKERDAIQKQQDELLQEMKAFPLAIKDLADEVETKSTKADLEKQQDAFQLQLQHLREEMEASFETRLLKQKEESKKELEAALSKYKENSKQELLTALSTFQEKSEKDSQEVMSTFQTETRKALEETNSALGHTAKAGADGMDAVRKEQTSLRSELSSLTERVDESLEQFRQHIADARASVSTNNQQLDKCEKKMLDHDIKLSMIDMSIWNDIADLVSFTFPAVENRVNNMKTELERLKSQQLLASRSTPAPASAQLVGTASPSPAGQSVSGTPVPSTEKHIIDVMDKRFETIAVMLGKMVEEMRVKVKDVQQLAESIGHRVGIVEQQRASDHTEIDDVKMRVVSLEEQAATYGDYLGKLSELNEQIASLEEQATSNRNQLETLVSTSPTASYPPKDAVPTIQTVEALEEAFSRVQAEWTKTQQEIASLQMLIGQKSEYFDSLKHQISALNSRYENLRTEDLAKAILGQLETLYPTPGAIRSDLQENKKRLSDIEESIQMLKQEGDLRKEDLKSIINSFNAIEDEDRPAKRSRIEHNFGGALNGTSNGLVSGRQNGSSRIANGKHN